MYLHTVAAPRTRGGEGVLMEMEGDGGVGCMINHVGHARTRERRHRSLPLCHSGEFNEKIWAVKGAETGSLSLWAAVNPPRVQAFKQTLSSKAIQRGTKKK